MLKIKVTIFTIGSFNFQEFDPVYKKVAKKMLKSNDKIVFGRMDATVNDVPYMFPQLKVVNKNREIAIGTRIEHLMQS